LILNISSLVCLIIAMSIAAAFYSYFPDNGVQPGFSLTGTILGMICNVVMILAAFGPLQAPLSNGIIGYLFSGFCLASIWFIGGGVGIFSAFATGNNNGLAGAALAFLVLGTLAFISSTVLWMCRPLSKLENGSPAIVSIILAAVSLVMAAVALGLNAYVFHAVGSGSVLGWTVAGPVLALVVVALILGLQFFTVWQPASFSIFRAILIWIAMLVVWVLGAGAGVVAEFGGASAGRILSAAFAFLFLSAVSTSAFTALAGFTNGSEEGSTGNESR